MALSYGGVNWLAVVVAAIAFIVINIVWYSPQVLGARWAAATGRPAVRPTEVRPTTWVIGIITALLTAYVLALFAGGLGATSLVDGAVVGFWAWLGFVVAATVPLVLFEGRSTEYWAIIAGSWLVNLLVMGAIIGYWR